MPRSTAHVLPRTDTDCLRCRYKSFGDHTDEPCEHEFAEPDYQHGGDPDDTYFTAEDGCSYAGVSGLHDPLCPNHEQVPDVPGSEDYSLMSY